jgi:hypothetical protein
VQFIQTETADVYIPHIIETSRPSGELTHWNDIQTLQMLNQKTYPMSDQATPSPGLRCQADWP